MRDPILAANLIACSFFLTVRVRRKLGFEIGILRPPRPNTCSLFNHGTNQCRSRTGQVANFAKRDNFILIYTPNCWHAGIEFSRPYTVYFLKEHFQSL